MVKVRYMVFGNFSSHKIYNTDNTDEKMLKESVWNDIKDEDWDWPITKDDLEITSVTKVAK